MQYPMIASIVLPAQRKRRVTGELRASPNFLRDVNGTRRSKAGVLGNAMGRREAGSISSRQGLKKCFHLQPFLDPT